MESNNDLNCEIKTTAENQYDTRLLQSVKKPPQCRDPDKDLMLNYNIGSDLLTLSDVCNENSKEITTYPDLFERVPTYTMMIDTFENVSANLLTGTGILVMNQNCEASESYKPCFISRYLYLDCNHRLRHIKTTVSETKTRALDPRLSVSAKRQLFTLCEFTGTRESIQLHSYREPNFLSPDSCTRLVKKFSVKPETSILSRVNFAGLSPCGEFVAVAGKDMALEIYDVNTSKLLRSKFLIENFLRYAYIKLCRWVEESEKIFFGQKGWSHIYLLNTETGAMLFYKETPYCLMSVDYTLTRPTMMLLGGDDSTVKVWDMRSPIDKQMLSIPVPKYWNSWRSKKVESVCWNPRNSNEFLSATSHFICVTDLRKPEKPRFEMRHSETLYCALLM